MYTIEYKMIQFMNSLLNLGCKWVGNDAIVGNPNSASLRLRGTGKREGGEITQPLEDF